MLYRWAKAGAGLMVNPTLSALREACSLARWSAWSGQLTCDLLCQPDRHDCSAKMLFRQPCFFEAAFTGPSHLRQLVVLLTLPRTTGRSGPTPVWP